MHLGFQGKEESFWPESGVREASRCDGAGERQISLVTFSFRRFLPQ